MRNEPPSPPIVAIGGSEVTPAYLLCWEQHERDGSWHAWVTWIRTRRGEPYRHVVAVRADVVKPLETAGAYRDVPRLVRGLDGVIRPWVPGRPRPVAPPDWRG